MENCINCDLPLNPQTQLCDECNSSGYPTPKYPDVRVQLSGNSGNAFAIIGSVQKALRSEVNREVSNEWVNHAMAASSYDNLLQRAMSWVDVG